jgi:four helix bundle protein
MAYKSFEENLSWQKVQDLTLSIHNVFKNCNENWFRDELMESVVNAASHIAKGHERNNNEDNVKYLSLARESLVKCKSHVFIASRLKFCKEQEANQLQDKITDASKLIYGLMKHIKDKAA